MIALLVFPLGLLGLAAAPALVAVYLLRNRWRRRVVSSLMLWDAVSRSKGGGRKIQRIQTPLLVLLEVLAIILTSLAAANPAFLRPSAQRPLAIVLDDSYSMLAGGEQSPRARAIAAIQKELASGAHRPVHLVLAGPRPQVIARSLDSKQDVITSLEQWYCMHDGADLARGVMMAQSLTGQQGRVLVVTDVAPAVDPGTGPIRWLAVGRSMPNVAFINAARSQGDGDAVLLEVANFSKHPQIARVRLGNAEVSSHREFELSIGASQSVVLMGKALDSGAPVTASLAQDALEIDNNVTLLPQRALPVRVRLAIGQPDLAAAVGKAVAASGLAKIVQEREEVFVSDSANPSPVPEAWTCGLQMQSDCSAYTGPFVIDTMHPMLQGLGLEGVIWAAGDQALPGRPIVMAGDVPLLSESVTAGGARSIQLKLNPRVSTLQDWPDWPVMWWNMLRWRQTARPGPKQVNLRMGQGVRVSVPPSTSVVVIAGPDGRRLEATAPEGMMIFEPQLPGIHTFTMGTAEHAIAVNAMNRVESDLNLAVSGPWGSWLDSETVQMDYAPLAWAAALAAMALLMLHMRLLSRQAAID